MLFFRKRLKKASPEQEQEFSQAMEQEKVSHKDRFAMLISALLVLVLPALLVLLGFAGLFFLLMWLLF